MRRLWLVVLLGVCACAKKDAAIKLVITTAQARPDSCFEITLSSASTEPSVSTLPRTGGNSSFTATVQQGTNLPDDVEFKVQAWVSANGCAEPRWGNGVVTASGHFTKGDITTVEAKLDALPDTDGDHAVDAVDCAPNDVSRAPSLPERCGTRLDVDCDGVVACDDADCDTQPCVAALAVLDGGTIVAGQCASQTLTLLNAGAPEAPASAVPIVMSSNGDGGINYFSDSNCTSPATMLSVTAATAPFSFIPVHAGPVSISVTSTANYLPTQAAYVVTAGAPASVSIDAGAPATWLPGNCLAITSSWSDQFGNGISTGTFGVEAPGAATFNDGNCSQTGASALGAAAYFRAADEGDFTVTLDAGTAGGSVVIHVLRPFKPGMTTRWPLLVHTFENTPYHGYFAYTVSTTLDAGVPPSQVRAYFWSNGDWQQIGRVREGSTVEFALQTDLDAGADDNRYSLFAMDSAAAPESDQFDSVYLFADGFESLTLNKWTQRDGGFARSTAEKSEGSASLSYPDDNTTKDNFIEAAVPLNERDVRFCARWKRDTDTNFDFSQVVRLQSGTESQELNREGGHWALATVNNAAGWSQLGTDIGGALNDWDNVCVAEWDTADGGTFTRAWNNGAAPLRTEAVGVHTGAGNIGFRRHKTANGAVYLDDVRVRRYIDPEPSVTVMSPLQAP